MLKILNVYHLLTAGVVIFYSNANITICSEILSSIQNQPSFLENVYSYGDHVPVDKRSSNIGFTQALSVDIASKSCNEVIIIRIITLKIASICRTLFVSFVRTKILKLTDRRTDPLIEVLVRT